MSLLSFIASSHQSGGVQRSQRGSCILLWSTAPRGASTRMVAAAPECINSGLAAQSRHRGRSGAVLQRVKQGRRWAGVTHVGHANHVPVPPSSPRAKRYQFYSLGFSDRYSGGNRRRHRCRRHLGLSTALQLRPLCTQVRARPCPDGESDVALVHLFELLSIPLLGDDCPHFMLRLISGSHP